MTKSLISLPLRYNLAPLDGVIMFPKLIPVHAPKSVIFIFFIFEIELAFNEAKEE